MLGGVAGFLLLGALSKGLAWTSSAWMMIFGLDFTAMAAVGFVWCALLPATRVHRLCESHLLRFFGKYSYGIYIYHQVFQAQMMRYLYPMTVRMTHSAGLGAAIYFFIAIALVTLFAVVSYHAFEVRFLRMKTFFPYQPRAAVVTNSAIGS